MHQCEAMWMSFEPNGIEDCLAVKVSAGGLNALTGLPRSAKAQGRQVAAKAEQQYKKLLDVLRVGGLTAVGKRGEREGQILVLISCPAPLLKRLAQRER